MCAIHSVPVWGWFAKTLANDERLCEDFSQSFGKNNSTIIAF
jgi:hypothetical protein